jgi:hypothetical protein
MFIDQIEDEKPHRENVIRKAMVFAEIIPTSIVVF